MNILPTARTSEIIINDLKSELLIYDLTINKAFCLNKTSAIVYRACDGTETFASLKRKHNFTDDLIYLALDQLRADSLLADDTNFISPFLAMTRRETLRRVGFATIIALPIISSLIAPIAANAASGSIVLGSLGQPCASSADCALLTSFCIPHVNDFQKRCCVNSTGFRNTGDTVNSCFFSTPGCTVAAFTCQSNAGSFCCSGDASKVCTGTACFCNCI